MSTIRRVPDDAVERFNAHATVDWPFLTLADEPPGIEVPRPIRTFLAIGHWRDAAALGTAAAKAESMATDNQAFRIRADGDVVISDPRGDAVVVSQRAFHGLLVRLLGILLETAERRDDPVIGTSDWTAVVSARDTLGELLRSPKQV